jgi:hypothetical protein
MELSDRIEKYDLTVREIIGKLALEFIGQPEALLRYDIERALNCDHREARRLMEEFVNE